MMPKKTKEPPLKGRHLREIDSGDFGAYPIVDENGICTGEVIEFSDYETNSMGNVIKSNPAEPDWHFTKRGITYAPVNWSDELGRLVVENSEGGFNGYH
jgi:hypothetical protein